MKWCQTIFIKEIFFHLVNPKNKDGLTTLHMATINSQSLKYKLKKKMAAVFDHFRNFQPCTSICTKMTND